MKLLLPDLMYVLDKRPMLVQSVSGLPEVRRPSDPLRRKLAARLLPLMHKAEKFIFDSGSDQDERTITAVRETAVNMMEAGLFHLPFPIVWIEDPFESDPEGIRRFFYLAVEDEKEQVIRVWHLQSSNLKLDMQPFAETLGSDPASLKPYQYNVFADPLLFDLKEPSDLFILEGVKTPASPLHSKLVGEAAYGFKKFLVSLNTEQLEQERVSPPKPKPGTDKRFREYPHTIVRIPLDRDERGNVIRDKGTGRPRRRHLVRGFVWGKNTRPVEEQHWVRPHWRGDASRGTVERSHYKVG